MIDSPFPVIRLEVERMKHSMLVALSKYNLELDSMLKDALDKYCSAEHVEVILNVAAREAIDRAVKEEVSNFYLHGRGRKAIVAAIAKRLKAGDL